VIWCRILQLFYINDHHIETTCRVHHLGYYLEGQGHSMTLQQNRVWPKTLLFEVGFYNYFWQTTSLCPIPIPGAIPGSDRLFFISFLKENDSKIYLQKIHSTKQELQTIWWSWDSRRSMALKKYLWNGNFFTIFHQLF